MSRVGFFVGGTLAATCAMVSTDPYDPAVSVPLVGLWVLVVALCAGVLWTSIK